MPVPAGQGKSSPIWSTVVRSVILDYTQNSREPAHIDGFVAHARPHSESATVPCGGMKTSATHDSEPEEAGGKFCPNTIGTRLLSDFEPGRYDRRASRAAAPRRFQQTFKNTRLGHREAGRAVGNLMTIDSILVVLLAQGA